MDSVMKTYNICKGVKLCTYNTDRFKTVSAGINIAMPLDDGKAPARAVLLGLLSETNREYPTITKMTSKLFSLYGASVEPVIVKSGENQFLRLSMSCIDDRFALDGKGIVMPALTLLLDMLLKPNAENGLFPEKEVEKHKRLLIDKVRSMRDDKIVYASNRMVEEMFKYEAYSVSKYGTEESISAITGRDVFAAYLNMLLHAPMQINIVGSFDEEKAVALVKDRLSILERDKICELHTVFITEAEEEKTVREVQPVKQSKLVMGMRAGMTYDLDNIAAIKVMTDIFGSGTYSKLFTNVREKKSLCYYCSARLDSGKGFIAIQSGVEKENTEEAIKAIKEEFEDMKRGCFDDEVIKASKLNLRDSLNAVYDTPGDIDSWFCTKLTATTYISPEELSRMIEKVTREEIMVAASFCTFDTVYVLENAEEE